MATAPAARPTCINRHGLRMVCVAWLTVFAVLSYWLNAFFCEDIANNGLIRDKICMVFPPLLSCCYFAPAVILTMRRWDSMTASFTLRNVLCGLVSLALSVLCCLVEGRV